MIIDDVEKLFSVPEFEEVSLYPYPGIRQFFYESVPWKGKKTKVFACCGFPENASPEQPVPGVVLIHGGGATALADWVEMWNRMGFAAISMDTCGCIPSWSKSPYCNVWPRHESGGPPGWGKMELAMEPKEEQWMYHALSAVILGNSFLRSFPQVDGERIGVHGISWGGVLTLQAAAHDPRFKFAIPVYGSGFFVTKDSTLPYRDPAVTDAQREQWGKLFDPGQMLDRIKAPVFFLSGTNDVSFPFGAFWRSAELVSGPVRHLMYPDYPHNHTECWSEYMVEVFAGSAVRDEELPQVGPAEVCGNVMKARFEKMSGRVQAQFCWTTGTGSWAGRQWRSMPVPVKDGTVEAELPLHFTAGFFNISDGNGITLTSRPYWIA